VRLAAPLLPTVGELDDAALGDRLTNELVHQDSPPSARIVTGVPFSTITRDTSSLSLW
jgi:hypothetical protein